MRCRDYETWWNSSDPKFQFLSLLFPVCLSLMSFVFHKTFSLPRPSSLTFLSPIFQFCPSWLLNNNPFAVYLSLTETTLFCVLLISLWQKTLNRIICTNVSNNSLNPPQITAYHKVCEIHITAKFATLSETVVIPCFLMLINSTSSAPCPAGTTSPICSHLSEPLICFPFSRRKREETVPTV